MVKIILSMQQGNSNVAPFGEASQISRERFLLRRIAPNRTIFSGLNMTLDGYPQTPFRMAIHAGDPLLRQTEPGGPNQLQGRGLRFTSPDGTRRGTGASGNQHYVYDSSVYTRYRGLFAKLNSGISELR
jgi:hypothetical protein